MKYLIALCSVLLLCSTVEGAEFLINNRESHGTSEKGDIVCVRPDGFRWSESELPKVVKIPDMKYEDAVMYEKPLTELVPSKEDVKIMISEQVKDRKYKLPTIMFTGTKLDSSRISSLKLVDISEKAISAEAISE